MKPHFGFGPVLVGPFTTLGWLHQLKRYNVTQKKIRLCYTVGKACMTNDNHEKKDSFTVHLRYEVMSHPRAIRKAIQDRNLWPCSLYFLSRNYQGKSVVTN